MLKKGFLIASIFCVFNTVAQPPQLFMYGINNVPLPAELDKQVCISGMKYLNGKLYMASERCPVVFAFDPETKTVSHSISIQVPQNFEMEGMTSYKGNLFLVSENVAAIYSVDPKSGDTKPVQTSIPLPAKSKSGDGMEGIAANEKDHKFYVLRERNEDMSRSQIYTFAIEVNSDSSSISLRYESMIELPLENPQWRYSDICVDSENGKLICLKSFSKGKLRKQFIESIDIDSSGNLSFASLKNIPVENFSETSNQYKDQDYSMNLEGITLDKDGNIWIISDNTSGKAQCDMVAKEKTILLQLKRK
mgnify:CR=1 FL=1